MIKSLMIGSILAFSLSSSADVRPDSETICGEMGCKSVRVKLKKLAHRGNADAELLLARIYLDGVGVDVNYKKAERYLKSLAKAKNTIAALMLSQLYEKKVSGKQSESKYWLDKAAAFSGHSQKALSDIDALHFDYDPDSATLSQIAKALVPHTKGASGTGSRILGKGCGNDSSSICKSIKKDSF